MDGSMDFGNGSCKHGLALCEFGNRDNYCLLEKNKIIKVIYCDNHLKLYFLSLLILSH